MTPNPKGVMEKNNKLMMSMDKKRESNRVASEKKRTTSDGYMPRKIKVRSETGAGVYNGNTNERDVAIKSKAHPEGRQSKVKPRTAQ